MSLNPVKEHAPAGVFFPLEEEAAGEVIEAAGEWSCCLAITWMAFRKIGEFSSIPGTSEYGRRRTGAEEI
jgi:hypothetical protein